MTRTKIATLGVATLIGIGAIGFGVFMVASKAFGSEQHQSAADCATTGNEYIVTIQNSKLSIDNIHAHRCDKLTIVNADPTIRLMAFGVHDHHQAYDGTTEQALAQGKSLSVTLVQTGTFTFHDHLHDEVGGTFTVE
jgi:hypothetical protein